SSRSLQPPLLYVMVSKTGEETSPPETATKKRLHRGERSLNIWRKGCTRTFYAELISKIGKGNRGASCGEKPII
ncbi:MAG: hypothetical protein QXO71_05370, partial [Candidatus Jordarchaeaceae archaeon]